MPYELKIKITTPLMTGVLLTVALAAVAVGVYYDKVKMTDFAILMANLVGPIIAVQIQAGREEQRSNQQQGEKKESEVRERQLLIFRHMITFRSTPLNQYFIQAWSLVPLDFHGVSPVISAWKHYFSCVNKTPPEVVSIEATSDARVELLRVMGEHLGYHFSAQELKYEAYLAQAHVDEMTQRAEIFSEVHKILTDKKALPVLNIYPNNHIPNSNLPP